MTTQRTIISTLALGQVTSNKHIKHLHKRSVNTVVSTRRMCDQSFSENKRQTRGWYNDAALYVLLTSNNYSSHLHTNINHHWSEIVVINVDTSPQENDAGKAKDSAAETSY